MQEADFGHDRRKLDALMVIQNFVLPAIIAAVSSYVSVQITITTLQLDVEYLKRDLKTVEILAGALANNTSELKARGVWMQGKDKEDSKQNAEIDKLQQEQIRQWKAIREIERKRILDHGEDDG